MSSIQAACFASLLCCLCACPRARAQSCAGVLDRAALVRCALANSLDVQRTRVELKALAGRRIGAGLWLPSNPVVTASLEGDVTHVSTVPSPTLEWQVSLAQEIELGGQRRARLDVVDAEAAAQVRRVAVAEQETIAVAFRSAFEIIALRQALALAGELSDVSTRLADYADGRARESLLAPIDAHLVRAEAIRVASARAQAAQRLEIAGARLALLLNQRPGSVDVAVQDFPTPTSENQSLDAITARALSLRADVAAAQMERAVAEHQASVFRRSRAPNLTLSVFTGVNVLGDQVVGGTLSAPLPLPAPVGRTRASEIAEQQSRIDQAAIGIEEIRRRVRLDVAEAVATVHARADILKLFEPATLAQAQADLGALRDGIASRQLSVREALVSERTLIELLHESVDARLQYALAWVELRRTSGALGSEVRP